MKKLHCTLKVNAFEKRFVFPRLQKYCKEHKIKCTLAAEKQDGATVYRMEASADGSVIDACAKELDRINGMFPGKVEGMKVVLA